MQVNCPKCGKLVEYNGNEFRPFCSKRCKLNDLGDWASEKYGVPAEDHSSLEDNENNPQESNLSEDQD